MIKSLRLQSGHVQGSAPLMFDAEPLNVFVGPNNSGKSKLLSEVHHCCTSPHKLLNQNILGVLEFEQMDEKAISDFVAERYPDVDINNLVSYVNVIDSNGMPISTSVERYLKTLRDVKTHRNDFIQTVANPSTVNIGGALRTQLTDPQPGGDLSLPSRRSFHSLAVNSSKLERLRRVVKDSIGSYPVLEFLELGKIRLKLSDKLPESESCEIGIHSEARVFHRNSIHMVDTSDGIRAFVGIVTLLIASSPDIVLIDEPEAFLHPALSIRLGFELGRIYSKGRKRLFAATHSPYFLMGCIQSKVRINIIRLTFSSGIATARQLPNQKLVGFMRNPLLRSIGVLSALFYESVVVTEGDADRAFYSEINERILDSGLGEGIMSGIFLNAQNKQTIHVIMRPLREIGIPTAAIVDIDVVKDGGATWTNLLTAAGVPVALHIGLGQDRSRVKDALEQTGQDMKRNGGIALLNAEWREVALNLFARLAEYGVFVVPLGELESWLSELGAKGKSPEWLVRVFERMGDDPDALDYIRPCNGDVWDFVKLVARWLNNPNRRGMEF